MKTLNVKKALIIPDIHQNLEWADKALEFGRINNVDHIVFLGDFLDAYMEFGISGFKETLHWINSLLEKHGPEYVSVLIGNHDIDYLTGARTSRPFEWPAYSRTSAWTRNKQAEFNRYLKISQYVERVHIAIEVNGYLLSHAGFTDEFLDFANAHSPEYLATRWDEYDRYRVQGDIPHWSFAIGKARYGKDPIGGPCWLDFDSEMIPLEDIPQIVGHTYRKTGEWIKGNAYCIDFSQMKCVLLEGSEKPRLVSV